VPDWLQTLLAVIAGGLLTYFTQRALDVRRAEREHDREQREVERQEQCTQKVAAAELRVAKRLLLEELDTLALQLVMLIEEERYPQPLLVERRGARTSSSRPMRERASSARSAEQLDDDQWDAVARYMHTVPGTRALLLGAQPESPIPDARLQELQESALLASDLYPMLGGELPPSIPDLSRPPAP
jgi:hypothetical protein